MHFNDLRIYQIAISLEKEVFNIVIKIPYSWNIEQIDQIKRSSSSISTNIIEGWNRRFYPRDFLRFLAISLGSSDETQHHIRILFDKNYISKDIFDRLSNEYKNLSIKILNFINYLKKKHKIKQPL